LIKACTEIGWGGLGFFVGSGVGVALGRADGAEVESFGSDATVDVADEACGALAGSPALQASSTMAAGNIQYAFTQPVSLHVPTVIRL
jgi:hypothetical protein